jgi:hypothetical protein
MLTVFLRARRRWLAVGERSENPMGNFLCLEKTKKHFFLFPSIQVHRGSLSTDEGYPGGTLEYVTHKFNFLDGIIF